MRYLRPFFATLAVAFMCLSTAQGALVSRLSGLAYYDEEQNITWIADFNLAATNSFGLAYDTNLGDHPNDNGTTSYTEQIVTGGSMNWGAALWWIDAMNAAGYLGADAWRLPDTPTYDLTCDDTPGAGGSPTDGTYGYDCTGSEMAYLYYVHGITPGTPGGFSNIQSDTFEQYWTGVEFLDYGGGDFSHVFSFETGRADLYNKYIAGGEMYAMAVLDGDIAAVVPLPPAVALFGSAIAFLGWQRRRTA